jgi:hypothetical protein
MPHFHWYAICVKPQCWLAIDVDLRPDGHHDANSGLVSRGGLPMEATAFDLLIVPTLWVTFGGIVVGAVLLALMQWIENMLMHLAGAWREQEKFPPTGGDLLLRPARPVTHRKLTLHG